MRVIDETPIADAEARERRVALAQADARFITAVKAELDSARTKHKGMNSLHEAYAVILEEMDELWDEVKKRRELRREDAVREELIQIAAMCWRAFIDLKM